MSDLTREYTQHKQKAIDKLMTGECTPFHEVHTGWFEEALGKGRGVCLPAGIEEAHYYLFKDGKVRHGVLGDDMKPHEGTKAEDAWWETQEECQAFYDQWVEDNQ